MRLGSETAYRTALESWEALLQEKSAGESEFAQELFAIADTLTNAPSLTAALEDGARDSDARAKLAADVLEGKVCGEVEDLVIGLARSVWSENGDLLRAVEILAVQTLLIGAQREGVLDQVESELYEMKNVLVCERELRNLLTDEQYGVADRQRLAHQIMPNLTAYSRLLLERAVDLSHRCSVRLTIAKYLECAGERGEHLVASVTAAIPLTAEQEQRLAAVLIKKYGKEVRIHTTIDTSVVGGVRILVGTDVIEGTIASRLAAVKEVFSNGR